MSLCASDRGPWESGFGFPNVTSGIDLGAGFGNLSYPVYKASAGAARAGVPSEPVLTCGGDRADIAEKPGHCVCGRSVADLKPNCGNQKTRVGCGGRMRLKTEPDRMAWVRQKAWWLRSDRPELLFGNAVVQCGLDGGPSVTDGCWWVVRVVVKVFDELSGVVSRPPCGFKDEWDQIDVGVSVELFLFPHVWPCSPGERWRRS